MNKKMVLYFIIVIVLSIVLILIFNSKSKKEKTSKLEVTVLHIENDLLTVQDSNDIIYTFNSENVKLNVGDSIILEYSGLIDSSKSIQDGNIVSYKARYVVTDENGIPTEWLDDGIFSTYYVLAYNKLKSLTLEEKIGQLLLVRYPESNAVTDLKKYNFSGFVLYEKDFKDKTKDEVISMIQELQENSNIPLLIAVDEEGGKVVRVSSNPNLRSEKFKSSQQLYDEGGFDLIKKDVLEKSELLKSLGINLNLAPVVDVSTDSNSYIYPRTIGKNTQITSEYAKTVIESSKGTGVSYTLKHFPGYANNLDTHTSGSIDTRTYEDILKNDIPPFEAGIKVGAESVLVSHNIVSSIDPNNPASLSSNIHNLLRSNLGFTGVIVTDDISMDAVNNLGDTTIDAILAGNNLVITTDYEVSFNEIKTSLESGILSEDYIDKLVFKVLAWKYYKGLMINTK